MGYSSNPTDFPPSIVIEITNIILPSNPALDCLLWDHERKGQYSMRGGYRFLKQMVLTKYIRELEDNVG